MKMIVEIYQPTREHGKLVASVEVDGDFHLNYGAEPGYEIFSRPLVVTPKICTECGQTQEGDFHTYCPARVSPPSVVETPEQLDALPFLALIREIFRPSPGSGTDYGGVYERRTSGWEPIAGVYEDDGRPRLPCRVLYDPRSSM